MQKKIFLLIDDDKDDRQFFKRSLTSVEPEVECIEAFNGKEALDLLQRGQTIPDVIFLDINMPVMTGWECLTRLKKLPDLKDIPVIMFSTSSNQRDVNIAYELGATCYCVKPDAPGDVKTVIRYVADCLSSKRSGATSPSSADSKQYPKYFQFPTISF